MPNSTHPPAVISLDLERLKSLPARAEVWQLALARMPNWVDNGKDKPFRPLVALCRHESGGMVASGDACAPGDPQGPAAIAAVAKLAAMRDVGYRPIRVDVRDPMLADAVRDGLASCGIEVGLAESLGAVDELIADMTEHLTDDDTPRTLFAPGIDVAMIRAFTEAAAEFYRTAPWNELADTDLIQVESDGAPRGFGCFTVLGCAGVAPGFGFFESPRAFQQFMQPAALGPRVGPSGFWTMGFREIMDLPIADADLFDQHDLQVAGADAYPALVCLMPGGSAKPAEAEHLAFVEALMRAISATTEDEIDLGRWSKSVQTSHGPVTIELSMPSLLESSPRAGRHADGGPPDRRVMERSLRDVHKLIESGQFGSAAELNAYITTHDGQLPATAPDTSPRGRAQELLDRAFEVEGRLRIKLAREALRVWPDCAEAWVLQAEQMPDRVRRRDLYRNAVEAAERALGPQPFVDEVGHFWGVLETRPYMRARNGLAGALWDAGQQDEAIAHWLDMLRLNPNDNMGVRNTLVPHMLEVGRDAEAEEVLGRFEGEPSAMLAYCHALIEFRRGGPARSAQARLDTAIRRNARVPLYLTGRATMMGPLPNSYSPGSDEEARLTAAAMFMPFSSTKGALDWLTPSIRPPKSERRAARAKGAGKKRK